MGFDRRIAMLAGVLALVVAACTGPASPGEVEGLWMLESIEVNGTDLPVEIGVTTAEPAWVEFGEWMEGSAGCNHFTGGYAWDGDRLVTVEVMLSAVDCDDPASAGDEMAVEEAFTGVMWGPDFARVRAAGPEMTWTDGGTVLRFARTESLPTTAPPPPPTEAGLLDCSPGFVVQQRITDTTEAPEAILRAAAPQLARVEEGRPLQWWGYDPGGTVVAGLFRHDLTRIVYDVLTCSE